jgi:decaprenyl-phosphate phosphoribosyltransferase
VDRPDQQDGATPAPSSSLLGLVRLARPRQWTKNLLVVVAPAAAGVLFHAGVAGRTAAAFAIFCVGASGTYFVNDAIDAPSDAVHPSKRNRPIPAGQVTVTTALVVGFVLMAGAAGLGSWLAGWRMALVMGIYALVNVAYSLGLKHEPVLDLAAVSAGFVLRAIAGGVATGIPLSNWFLIVASFGSLLIVAGKRSGEKQLLTEEHTDHDAVRPTLGSYTPEFLRTVRTLAAAVTVAAYCLWAFERASEVHRGHDPVWFQLTIVPFTIALLHLLRLFEAGRGAEPEELALHDRRLQIYGLCWVALFACGVYA